MTEVVEPIAEDRLEELLAGLYNCTDKMKDFTDK